MKVTFLGTGGLVPGLPLTISGKRGMPSYMIDDDYLIDLGEGAIRNINAHNVNLHGIKRILISHLHPDHFLGIVNVLFAMVAYQRREPLEIIGPVGIGEATRNLVLLCKIPVVADDRHRGFQLLVRELGNYNSLEDILTVKGSHPCEAHAYRITREGKSVFYDGESHYTPELMNLATGVDLFISTVAVLERHPVHVAPEEVGPAVTSAGVKRLAVVHWPTKFEENQDEFKKIMEKYYDGEVIIANDFTTIEV
jgi:ribonuclease Z